MYLIWKTVSAKLSWSHYLELIKIAEELKDFILEVGNDFNFIEEEYRVQLETKIKEMKNLIDTPEK